MRKIVFTNEDLIDKENKKIQVLRQNALRNVIQLIPRGITLDELKVAYIDHVLALNGGVKTNAAIDLGVKYGTLVRFLRNDPPPEDKIKGRKPQGPQIGGKDEI